MSNGKEIQKDVAEMSRIFDEMGLGTDAPGTDPPPTDPPGTDAPPTQAPSTDAPSTDAPSTGAPTTEAPVEDDKDKIIENLRKQVEELSGKKDGPAPKTDAPKTDVPPTEVPISEEDFLGDADLDELTRDPSSFNKLLNRVYKSGIEAARSEMRKGNELVIRSVPDIVKNNIALVNELRRVNEEFYTDNPDLKPFSKVVGAVFEDLISKDPDKPYNHFINKDEKSGQSLLSSEVRNRLELHVAATRKDKDKNNPPNLPRKKGGPRQKSKLDTSPLLNELDEMDKVIER